MRSSLRFPIAHRCYKMSCEIFKRYSDLRFLFSCVNNSKFEAFIISLYKSEIIATYDTNLNPEDTKVPKSNALT